MPAPTTAILTSGLAARAGLAYAAINPAAVPVKKAAAVHAVRWPAQDRWFSRRAAWNARRREEKRGDRPVRCIG